MTIIHLEHRDPFIAQEILNVQHVAAERETRISGFDGTPHEVASTHAIQTGNECFFGIRAAKELIGFLAYHHETYSYEITRLYVVPKFFRQRVASQLISYFINNIASQSIPIYVQVGSHNTPALKLYQRFGFVHERIVESKPGVWLQYLVRN